MQVLGFILSKVCCVNVCAPTLTSVIIMLAANAFHFYPDRSLSSSVKQGIRNSIACMQAAFPQPIFPYEMVTNALNFHQTHRSEPACKLNLPGYRGYSHSILQSTQINHPGKTRINYTIQPNSKPCLNKGMHIYYTIYTNKTKSTSSRATPYTCISI